MDEDYLKQPRQWDIGNIGRFMLFIGRISSLLTDVTFGVLLYSSNRVEQRGAIQTGGFVESLLSQCFIVHVIRTGKIPFIQSKASFPLLVTTIANLLAWTVAAELAVCPCTGTDAAAARLLLALLGILVGGTCC